MPIDPGDLIATPARMMAVVVATSAMLACAAMLAVLGPAGLLPQSATQDAAADRRRCDALPTPIDVVHSSRTPKPDLVTAIENETAAMRMIDGYDGAGADPRDPLQTCTRPPRMNTRT